MNVVAFLGWVPVIGVAAGLARAKFRRLPLVAAAIVLVAYLAYIVSISAWAATCWDCEAGLSETRGDVLFLSAVFFGLYALLTLVGIWLGARFSASAARLIVALRQTANAMRSGPPSRHD